MYSIYKHKKNIYIAEQVCQICATEYFIKKMLGAYSYLNIHKLLIQFIILI